MFGSSNNPLVDIGVSMTLRDHFSGPADDVISSWRNIMNTTGTFSRAMNNSFSDSLRRNWNALKAIGSTFNEYASVQKNIFLTNKMIGDQVDHQQQLFKEAQELNRTNPLDLKDITSGQKFMAMAGLKYEQIAGAIKPAADLAAIFNMELGGKGGTADLMTNIMSTFQLTGSEARRVADILGTGTTSANISLEDLAQSIKYVGANAKMVGMDISEVTAAIGILGNYGIQGSMAGTSLGQALSYLNKAITGANEKGLNALQALGIHPDELKDAQGNLINIHDIFARIARASEGLGGSEKMGLFLNLFNLRGIRAAVPLIEDIQSGVNNYQRILGGLNNSKGWSENTIEELMKTPEGRIKALQATWQNFITTIGESVAQYLVPAMSVITSMLKGVNDFLSNTGVFGKWLRGFVIMIPVIRVIQNVWKLISFTSKLVSGHLISSNVSSKGLSANLAQSSFQAGMLETHLKNIQVIMASTMMKPGQNIHLIGGTVSMDKNGVVRMTPNDSRVPVGTAFFNNLEKKQSVNPPTVIGGRVPFSGGKSLYSSSMRSVASSPAYGYMRNSLQMGKSVSVGITRVGLGIKSLGTTLAGFLGGPWGLLIAAGIAFVPQIFDWLQNKGNNEELEDSIEARQKSQEEAFRRALRESQGTGVNLSINGTPKGYYGPGSNAEFDIDDEYYGMGY